MQREILHLEKRKLKIQEKKKYQSDKWLSEYPAKNRYLLRKDCQGRPEETAKDLYLHLQPLKTNTLP